MVTRLVDLSGISDKIFYSFIGEAEILMEEEITPVVERTQNSLAIKDVITIFCDMAFWEPRYIADSRLHL